jgi:hypothetical protein
VALGLAERVVLVAVEDECLPEVRLRLLEPAELGVRAAQPPMRLGQPNRIG